jgi:glycosyltransferase involved in cell wall biosynthesis
VAIVVDYLNQRGGAEWVVAILHTMYPEAPIFTPIVDRANLWPQLRDADIRVSWMQRLPGLRQHFRKYFPLYPLAVEGFDLSGYDVVLSSSCAFGHGARAPAGAVHVCYCHTPARFVWDYENYVRRERIGGLGRRLLPRLVGRMRRWDLRAAQRPHHYVANSTAVADRIRRHYRRDSVVIPPPVEVSRFSASREVEDYYVALARLVPYRRIDLAVEAFNRLDLPLRVVGDGPARAVLERMAGPNVRFLGRRSDAEVSQLLARAQALVVPGAEDFGISLVEANAAGRPVVALRAGGALDTVAEGITGVTFSEQTAEALADAVRRQRRISWDPRGIRRHAEQYDVPVFQRRMGELMASALDRPRVLA